MRSYKLITFDVTGTLLSFKKAVGKQYGEIGRQFDVTVDPDLLNRNFKIQWNLISKKYPNYGLNSNVHFEDWWKILIKNTFINSVDYEINKERLEELSNRLIQVYGTQDCWELNDGVTDILHKIRETDNKVGIISNFDPSLNSILKEMKIYHYFDFIICSYNVGCLKPDIRIFQLAREKANVLSESAIHTGDDLYLDYQGALNAGWDACLLHKDDKTLLAKEHSFVNIDYVFPNLRALYRNLFINRDS